MNQPKVSVILPVYNVAEYLRQCMDSIVNQTLNEIEIICVDDGSTDSSLDILKEYADHDSRIKIICQKNAGAGAARNNGLSIATGKYLSFLDSDDFFELDMLEKAYTKIAENNADMVVFKSDQYREDLNTIVNVKWTLKSEYIPPYRPINFRTFTGNVFKVFVGWAWDKLFSKDFVDKYNLRFQEQRTSNDMLFVFSAVVLAEKIEIVDDVLAHQRRNNPSSLSNTREKSWQCFYEALKALRSALQDYNLYWILEQDYINYALHFSLWNVETLNGPKKEILYNILKDEWFSELGVDGHDDSYFYNKTEYKKYLKIQECSFEEYFDVKK
jgi:glycosyltransferase involved in cell wall biosynthesis